MDKCLFCGIPVPEGRQLCPGCEARYGRMPERCGTDGVQVRIGGVPVDPCIYEEVERHEGVTVTVLRCKRCGHVEIEWEAENGEESD